MVGNCSKDFDLPFFVTGFTDFEGFIFLIREIDDAHT